MTLEETKRDLIKDWGVDGKKIIEYMATIPVFEGTFDDFLSLCTPCGGNWGGLLLTGIQAFNPELWDLIPDHMGRNAFIDLCLVLRLWGIEV